jgi:hypothetical protein
MFRPALSVDRSAIAHCAHETELLIDAHLELILTEAGWRPGEGMGSWAGCLAHVALSHRTPFPQ